MINSNRVLVVLYRYIPEVAPRVFRWGSIVDELTSQNIDVDVICAALPNTPEFEIIQKARVFRISPWFKGSYSLDQSRKKTNRPKRYKDFLFFKIFRKRVKKFLKRLPINSSLQKYGVNFYHKFISILSRVFNNLQLASDNIRRWIGSLSWPEYGMYWILPAFLKASQLIRQNEYSAVITVSWPVSPHVVGWLIHKTVAKKPNWIVDIGDPFSFNTTTPINDFNKFGKLNTRFERSLLKNATSISVTTCKTREDYINFLPGIESKIFEIPPLIPKAQNPIEPNLKNLLNDNNQKNKLIFTGSLRAKNRRPDVILYLFDQVLNDSELKEKLELHFYGDSKQCLDSFKPYKNIIDKKIYLHGIVEKSFIDQIINTADFLVNIGNVTENQLPSKTVEYISTNRPIINISSSKIDSSWEIISKTGIGINIYAKGVEEINESDISQLLNFIKNPPPPMVDETLKIIIEPYSIGVITNQYKNLIFKK